FNSVKEKIVEYLKGNKISEEVSRYIDKLKQTADIRILNDSINSVIATDKKENRQAAPPAPPALTAKLTFSEPSGNNILDADEEGKLTITLQNSGKGDAVDVVAELVPSRELNSLAFERRIRIGKVPAGGTVTNDIILRTTDDLPTDALTFTVEVKESNGFDPQPMMITFRTKSLEPPKLVMADLGINDQSGGSRVEPGKIVEATVRIQNMGRGDARNVTAVVKLGQNVFMAGDSTAQFELGNLPSAKFKDFKFSFYTNNRIKNGDIIPIAIYLSEARPKFNAKEQLQLTMNATQKSALEFMVNAVEDEHKSEIQMAGGLSVDVDQNIPEGEKANKFDVAVVIGNHKYSAAGAPDVDYANRDAQMMRDYLTRTMGFDNIIYAENATLTKFYEIFGTKDDYRGKLFNWVKPGQSRVFVYYVGHGAPDVDTGEAYFVPVDAN